MKGRVNISMNCGHTVGPFESGNKSAGWVVPALRLWESGRPRGQASRAGILEVMVAVSVELL